MTSDINGPADWGLEAYDRPNSATVGMWDWVHEEVFTEPVDVTDETVTAILVTHNAADWLSATLASLDALTLQPDRIVVVDNGSTDATKQILADAVRSRVVDEVYPGDARWGFGRACQEALHKEDAVEEPTRWLWLLHDDVVIEETALDKLLERAHVGDAEIIGPKLLQMIRRGQAKQISELGASISHSGRRELALGQGEIDQGQHETSAHLGVSTCGMLISRRAWDLLGGFDPAIPLFREGVELGWRANLRGLRVVTCPEARIMHRQMGRAGVRSNIPHPTALDRRYGMMLVAAHKRGIAGVLTAIFLVLLSLARAVGFLLGKAPGRAADEMRAIGGFIRSAGKVAGLRRRIFRHKASARDINRTASLRPAWYAGIVNSWNAFATWVGDLWEDMFGRGDADTSIDELTGEEFTGTGVSRRRPRRPWLAPTMFAFVMVMMGAFLAARHILKLGHLSATELAPTYNTLAGMAQAYVAPVVGSPMHTSPPWVGFLLLLSTLFAGQPEWVISLLVIGSVPLSMSAGYLFFRRVASDLRVRLVASLLYGLLPALLGAITRGNLTVLVTAIVLPLLGAAVLAWRRRGTQGLESWRGAFAAALCLTIVASFQPLFLVLAAVLGILILIKARSVAHTLRYAVMLAVPCAVLAPWVPTLLASPARLVMGADPTFVSLTIPETWKLLLGRSPGEGLPQQWLGLVFFAVIWMIGIAGLFLKPTVARSWAIMAVIALTLAVFLPKFVMVVGPGGQAARPSATVWLLVLFASLLAMAAAGWDGVGAHLAQKNFGIRQAGSLAVLLLSFLVACVGVGWWIGFGIGPSMHRTNDDVIPAFAQQAQLERGTRTLAIDVLYDQPHWNLIENEGIRLGQADRGGSFSGDPSALAVTRQSVAQLANGLINEQLADNLQELGIGQIVLRNGTADQIASIGAMPGIQPAGGDEVTKVWRMSSVKAKAMVGKETEVQPVLPEGSDVTASQDPARQLIIAEPNDPRWSASLNGKPLKAVDDKATYRQRFELGAEAGKVSYQMNSSYWWAWGQLATFLLAVVLAAPALRRMESRDPAQYARRVAVMDAADMPVQRGRRSAGVSQDQGADS